MPLRTEHLRQRLTMAFLAILMVAAGAPGAVCASMATCPMMQQVAADCHGIPMADCEGPASQVGSGDDCCCVGEAPLAGLVPIEVTAPSFSEAAPASPPRDGLIAHSLRARPLVAATSPPRPAGRDLLSLHQTLLS